jgi:hypothetical protein
VLHYLEKIKKLIIFLLINVTGLLTKPQGCGPPVASAAGPFSKRKKEKKKWWKCRVTGSEIQN